MRRKPSRARWCSCRRRVKRADEACCSRTSTVCRQRFIPQRRCSSRRASFPQRWDCNCDRLERAEHMNRADGGNGSPRRSGEADQRTETPCRHGAASVLISASPLLRVDPVPPSSPLSFIAAARQPTTPMLKHLRYELLAHGRIAETDVPLQSASRERLSREIGRRARVRRRDTVAHSIDANALEPTAG